MPLQNSSSPVTGLKRARPILYHMQGADPVRSDPEATSWPPPTGRDPAINGLAAAQYPQTPYHPAMRNQATVEALVNKLGLGPQAASGSMSQFDLEAADREMSRFPEEIERLKATSPTSVARINAGSQLGTTQAEVQGRERVANIGAASDFARQQEVSRGTLANQKEIQAGKGSGYDLVKGLMEGNFGGRTPRSLSVPGVLSTSFESDAVAPSMFGQLDKARKAYEATRGFDWNPFGSTGDPALKAEVDRLEKLTGLAPEVSPEATENPQELENFARDIISDADAKALSWQQLQSMLPPELTPAQREQLRVHLTRLRGF